jgi:hypothetical protein
MARPRCADSEKVHPSARYRSSDRLFNDIDQRKLQVHTREEGGVVASEP